MAVEIETGDTVMEAVDGLEIELTDCGLGFPGHSVAWVDWSVPEGTALPVELPVRFGVTHGDTGAGLGGVASLAEPGPTLLVFSWARFFDAHDDHFDLEVEGFDVGRASSRFRVSGECGLSVAGSWLVERFAYAEKPVAVAASSEPSTVQELAWAIDFSDPSAPFLPLGFLIGEARDPYSEMLLLPDPPLLLEEMWEELSEDLSCLVVNYRYVDATVVQQRGCTEPARTGEESRAYGRFGDWEVYIWASDVGAANQILDSLRAYEVDEVRALPSGETLYGEG